MAVAEVGDTEVVVPQPTHLLCILLTPTKIKTMLVGLDDPLAEAFTLGLWHHEDAYPINNLRGSLKNYWGSLKERASGLDLGPHTVYIEEISTWLEFSKAMGPRLRAWAAWLSLALNVHVQPPVARRAERRSGNVRRIGGHVGAGALVKACA